MNQQVAKLHKSKKNDYHDRIREKNSNYLESVGMKERGKKTNGDMMYYRNKVKADFCLSTGRYKSAYDNNWMGGGAKDFVKWFREMKGELI